MSDEPTRTRLSTDAAGPRVAADPTLTRMAPDVTELRVADVPARADSPLPADATAERALPPLDSEPPRPLPARDFTEVRSPHGVAAPASGPAGLASSHAFGEGYALRDRYVLESMIGKGAMGQVWKAKDLLTERAGDRNPHVAIKVLTSDYEQHPRAFQALQREARRAQDLAHPNIVTVHVFDQEDRSGRVFIAMELLAGKPLDRVIRDTGGRGLPHAEAWRIIRDIGAGLAYAHRKKIVHSDLKPANVFLTADGTVKVLDFGIARAVKDADGASAVEDDSVMSGYTVTYAAPEVFRDAPPDTADDVFALGIVAYELLTGRHPFNRKPADEAQSAKLRPQPIKGISRRQWRAVERALSFDRETRWRDADAFLRALQGITPLQMSLAAAVVVMAVVAGVFWYRSYVASRPTIPFEQLPVAEQQIVRHALDTGNEALDLVRKNHVIEATADAADSFAEAYQHHPRNPEAVAGLEEAADRFIEWIAQQPDRAMAARELRNFQNKSVYYAKYAPLERAIASAESN